MAVYSRVDDLYSHLRDDCLYTGITSGPNARYGKPFYLLIRSGASPALLVPMTRRRTLGDRAFPVAGARVWNSLPATLTSQSSLLTFRHQLKTVLFERSYL